MFAFYWSEYTSYSLYSPLKVKTETTVSPAQAYAPIPTLRLKYTEGLIPGKVMRLIKANTTSPEEIVVVNQRRAELAAELLSNLLPSKSCPWPMKSIWLLGKDWLVAAEPSYEESCLPKYWGNSKFQYTPRGIPSHEPVRGLTSAECSILC